MHMDNQRMLNGQTKICMSAADKQELETLEKLRKQAAGLLLTVQRRMSEIAKPYRYDRYPDGKL